MSIVATFALNCLIVHLTLSNWIPIDPRNRFDRCTTNITCLISWDSGRSDFVLGSRKWMIISHSFPNVWYFPFSSLWLSKPCCSLLKVCFHFAFDYSWVRLLCNLGPIRLPMGTYLGMLAFLEKNQTGQYRHMLLWEKFQIDWFDHKMK